MNFAVKRAHESETFIYRSRIVRPDGILVYTEQRSGPIYDATGNVIGRHGTIQDISEQMRAEEALRTSEQLLRLLSDTLPAAISYIEKSGRLLENQ